MILNRGHLMDGEKPTVAEDWFMESGIGPNCDPEGRLLEDGLS